MTGAIITIGDEILIGQITDTNSAWLAATLTECGVHVQSSITIGDDADEIEAAVRSSYENYDITIVTGGLGPTHDDVTRDGVAAAFNVGLTYNPAIFDDIVQRFARRQRTVPESNKSQAMIPDGFEALKNDMGSAPGLWYRSSNDTPKMVGVVPGVPREMKWLVQHKIVPRLGNSPDGRIYRTFMTTGIGESNFQDLLRPTLDRFPPEVKVAYLPSLDGVRLRVGVSNDGGSHELLDAISKKIYEVAGRFIFSEENLSLEDYIVYTLRNKGMTIAIAESCTGGLISSRLTDVPGSSSVLVGGVIAYCNRIKQDVLGVPSEVIDSDGAVSSKVAATMATNVRTMYGSDIGLAITGIMGPDGGTTEKPVGTTWFAVDIGDGPVSVKTIFGTERLGNKRRASTAALNLVRTKLLQAD